MTQHEHNSDPTDFLKVPDRRIRSRLRPIGQPDAPRHPDPVSLIRQAGTVELEDGWQVSIGKDEDAIAALPEPKVVGQQTYDIGIFDKPNRQKMVVDIVEIDAKTYESKLELKPEMVERYGEIASRMITTGDPL